MSGIVEISEMGVLTILLVFVLACFLSWGMWLLWLMILMLHVALRLFVLEDKYESVIYSEPPVGVVCDCDDEHFHVRCMSALCDVCGVSEVLEDFVVFSKGEGFRALASYCRGLGWVVNEVDNYYTCSECLG